MKSKRTGHNYVLIMQEDELFTEQLTKFCKEEKIEAATFAAIGAVKEIELGYYDLKAKAYKWKKAEAELEIDNITGNVALLEGQPYIHAHATVSDREMHSFGGHLKEATIGASCEIFLTILNASIERKHDQETGLMQID